jgi:hypothetical protein
MFAVYGDVRTAGVVVCGGGGLVAGGRGWLKVEGGEVGIVAVVSCRKIGGAVGAGQWASHLWGGWGGLREEVSARGE